jgi:ABC-type bacteriocin/lantibiotic exporter with double-glycine peptidase domain
MTSLKERPLQGIGWRGSGGRLTLKILRRHRHKVAAILMATLGVYASTLSVPIVTQQIIDGITTGKSIAFISVLGILAVLCAVVDVVMADIRRLLVGSLGQKLERHISLETMRHLLGSRTDTATYETGEVLNRAEQTERIRSFLINRLPGAIFDGGGAAIATMVIFAYSLDCGVAVLVIASGGFFLSKRVMRDIHANASLEFKLINEKKGYLAETIRGLATIKSLAIEGRRFHLWAMKIKSFVAVYGNTEHVLRRLFRITSASQHLLTLAVVGIGGAQMLHGSLTIGELLAILMLTGKISAPLINAADIMRHYQQVTVAVQELGHLLDAPRDRADIPISLRPPMSGGIAFHNVTYHYRGSPTAAVAGLSLELPASGLVAMVGRNGSGKSTVLRLLQGFLRDFDGDIVVGGLNLRSYHPRWLRSQIAVVNQETALFAGSIRENVTSWASGVAELQIEAALRLAGAWDFIEGLPDKLETRLVENGTNLSGGERQRLSVARAVLQDPKIILLDEPTAFLDAEAAVSMEERLCAWGKGRLMILITHHLAAARLADSIILMDGGMLAARGSHSDLLKISPLYCSMWKDYIRGSGVEHNAETLGFQSNSVRPTISAR